MTCEICILNLPYYMSTYPINERFEKKLASIPNSIRCYLIPKAIYHSIKNPSKRAENL